jgi:AraC-like DNA-binding protein
MLDLLAALKSLGVPLRALCREIGLSPSAPRTMALLRDPAARIPAVVMANLLAAAERYTGDPLIGVHVGERAEPRGPLAYLVMSSPHLGDARRAASRRGLLILDSMKIELAAGPETASLTFDVGDAFLEHSHQVIDYLVMIAVRALRRAHGTDFALREVDFRHPEPNGCAGMTERAFGCTVRFGRRQNRLVFAPDSLRASSRLANPFIAEQIEKFAAALAARVAVSVPLNQRVAWTVRALLAHGVRADCATVARQLCLSLRTLQRGLLAEGLSFKAIRDAELWEVADALLSHQSLSVKTVALSVGFRDLAAFSKAFKHWAGCSPTQYRERLAIENASPRTLAAKRVFRGEAEQSRLRR